VAKASALDVSNVGVVYGGAHPHVALRNVSLHIDPGVTFAIVGPSGAGKSTLLRVIAGLQKQQQGDVRLGGISLDGRDAKDRCIALVFQYDALFPTMSVRENLRFALRNGRHAKQVDQIAEALHVRAHLDRRPRDLSGGERQRVALARALLSDPLALLLDEPLAHLDPVLRTGVRDGLRDLRARFEGPILYVTHDHAEAMSVSDRLGVLIEGRLEDQGDPQRVYDAPANSRVARFLGSPAMNMIEDDSRILGIRPEHVRVVADERNAAVRGIVARRESIGADAYVHVQTPRGLLLARVPAECRFAKGETVLLEFPERYVRFFDTSTGEATR
jgi:multiple sugar transport system ATP-binding protein